jgi:hypothetical protein
LPQLTLPTQVALQLLVRRLVVDTPASNNIKHIQVVLLLLLRVLPDQVNRYASSRRLTHQVRGRDYFCFFAFLHRTSLVLRHPAFANT